MASADPNHPNHLNLDDYLDQLGRSRVLVVGDVMLDQYWRGEVHRISPEAPVPVVAVRDTWEQLGGAGNVATSIAALGGHATLLAIIGDDKAGQSITDGAAAAGITAHLIRETDLPTTTKLRVIAQNQQLLRADFENHPKPDSLVRLRAQFDALVAAHDVVVFSDYGKHALAEIEPLIARSRAATVPTLVDPKATDFARYRDATMITPNLAEFEAAIALVTDNETMTARATAAMAQYGLQSLLVTLGAKGMTLFSTTAEPLHLPARVREIYDVSGAGDTVIAVMAMAMAVDLPKRAAMELANGAAGVVVAKLGTATVTPTELRAAIAKQAAP